MASLLIRAVYWFARVLTLLMFAQALMSWFVRDSGSPLEGIYRMITQITSPIVDPVRSFMSRFNTGMFDFSIWVSMILVQTAANLIIWLLRTLLY